MTARTILALVACSVVSHAQTAPANVAGTYHFTTPQTPRSMEEAAGMIRLVAPVSQASFDISTASLNFSGSGESVTFAEWVLPEIDKATGDTAMHEYRMASGDVVRVIFVPHAATPQNAQELLTVLRTVADVQKLHIITPNHAIVLRGPEWQVLFAQWIIDQLNQPAQQKPDTTPREFTVGGPDFRGTGHGARVNFLARMTQPRQTQEVLTVLRTVGDVQKVFSYTGSHALVLRAGDSDLQRAEWLIQQLDLPAGGAAGASTFTALTGDDVTRIFSVPNAGAQWLKGAATSMRTELSIKKVFMTTVPANLVVRGTADQIAAVTAWMASHNALSE
jgi:hypothetical protein